MPVTLRAWLSLLTFFAVLAAVCFGFPEWLADYVMAPLWFIALALYGAGLIYGTPQAKAFAVGALGAFAAWHFSALGPDDPLSMNVLVTILVSVLAGFLFQGAWSLVGKKRRTEERQETR